MAVAQHFPRENANSRALGIIKTDQHQAEDRPIERVFPAYPPFLPTRMIGVVCQHNRTFVSFHLRQTCFSACIFLISAIAFAGDRPLGQTFARGQIVQDDDLIGSFSGILRKIRRQ